MRSVPRRLGLSLVILGCISVVSSLLPAGASDLQAIEAAEETEVRTGPSGLPVPRFVALKADKVYGRMGPSFDVDVVVVYRRRGLPVKVIAETSDNVWRRIEDLDGRRVWINQSMLVENKHAVTTADSIMYADPSTDAAPRARLQAGVMAKLEACDADWCRIRTEEFRGWAARDRLWGTPIDF